eukprot:825261_1
MGDFYHELAVKVAEVCYAYKSKNGGIMALKEVRRVLNTRGTKFKLNANANANVKGKGKGSSSGGSGSGPGKYSVDDNIVAIGKLSKLGSGFRTVLVGSTMMVLSVPTELDNDHVQVIQCAQKVFAERQEGITFDLVRDMMTQWNDDRVKRALDLLLSEGIAWLDCFN